MKPQFAFTCNQVLSLQWRHNERDGVPNYRRPGCLLNLMLKRRSKKTWKLRVTGVCEGNPLVTGGSPHKGPVTWKMFPFEDIIMVVTESRWLQQYFHNSQHALYAGVIETMSVRLRVHALDVQSLFEVHCPPSTSHLSGVCVYYHHTEAETKWPTFRRRHFQKHFLEWKYINFD